MTESYEDFGSIMIFQLSSIFTALLCQKGYVFFDSQAPHKEIEAGKRGWLHSEDKNCGKHLA